MKMFSCPKLVRYCISGPLTWCALIGIAFVISNAVKPMSKEQVLLLVVFLIVGCCWLFFPIYYIYRNAFVRIEVTESGLSNKYTSVKWSEIDDFYTLECRIGRWPARKTVNVLCIGSPRYSEFHQLDPHRILFFSLNKKTKEILRSHAKGELYHYFFGGSDCL